MFLAGCLVLALPGLVMFGVSANAAFTAWHAAQAAVSGTEAAGSAMRTSTLLLVERGQLHAAVLAAEPRAGALVKAEAATDDALARTEEALRAAELPLGTVAGTRATLAELHPWVRRVR